MLNKGINNVIISNIKTAELKKMKSKKGIFLISFAVFLAVASFFYTLINGQTYHLQMIESDNNVKIIYDKEGIVECIDASLNDGVIIFKSISPGNTNIQIISDYESISTNISVNKLGIIFFYGMDFNGSECIAISAIIFLVVLAAVMLISFKKQIKISIFAYKNISYLGVALFSIFLFIFIAMFSVGDDSLTLSFYSLSSTVAMITVSFQAFVILFLPVTFILSIALSLSNISLVRHEGFRPANLLGIAFSILLLIGACILLFSNTIFDSLFANADGITGILIRIQGLINIFCGVTLCYFESLLFGSVICGVKAARHKPKYDKDYIIILGCGIAKDGSLLPLLRGRVDKAIEFYKKQKEESGKSAVFIPSGGQGPDEIISESEAMRNYLISKGISEDKIIMEDKSTTTYENMLFSKQIIDSINPESKVAFSTTNYHVFRSGILANSVGLHAEGIGSKTKWYFWPNAFLRELVGVVVSKIKVNILIVSLIAIAAMLLTAAFRVW